MMDQRTKELLAVLEGILLWSWIAGITVLLIWVTAVLLPGDLILQIHGRLFGLSKHELDVVMYCGMALWKMGVIMFFFIPWLSIRLQRKSS